MPISHPQQLRKFPASSRASFFMQLIRFNANYNYVPIQLPGDISGSIYRVGGGAWSSRHRPIETPNIPMHILFSVLLVKFAGKLPTPFSTDPLPLPVPFAIPFLWLLTELCSSLLSFFSLTTIRLAFCKCNLICCPVGGYSSQKPFGTCTILTPTTPTTRQ